MTSAPLLSWISIGVITGLGAASVHGDALQERSNVPPGTIFGRVVDRDTGAPVRFAAVQLARLRVTRFAEGIAAGEDGAFAFPDLQPGVYFVAAESATHAPSFYSTEKEPAVDPGSPITVAAGQRIGPIEIHAIRGGVIAGTVSDTNGDPAAGVPIQIQPWPPIADRGSSPFYFSPFFNFSPRSIWSDSQGAYRAFGLPPAEYLVSAGAWYSPVPKDPVSGRSRKQQRVYFPGTTDPVAAVPVTVGSGQEQLGIDVKLKVAALYKVRGTIDVPTGANVEGIMIRFLWSGRPVESDLPYTFGRQWSATEMPPGNYWVVATATEPYVEAPQPMEGRLWWAKVPLTIGSDDVSGVSLTLQSSSLVNGRIEFESGSAVPGTEFRGWKIGLAAIAEAPPLVRSPWSIEGQVDTSGQFTIRNVMPGRYRLRAYPPTDTGTIRSATLAGRPLNGLELEVTADVTNVNDLVVRVRR